MINIIIKKNINDDICGFVVEGHANFAARGSDIVCSAISILVANTINSIKLFTDELIDYSISDNSNGRICCSFPNLSNGFKNHDVSLLLNSMVLGFLYINKDYFKYIKITYLEA